MAYRVALVIMLGVLILTYLSLPGNWEWVMRRLDDLSAEPYPGALGADDAKTLRCAT